MPRKVKVAKIEPEEVKVKAKGVRKGKKELVAHEVLLKELAKVKEPVKTQRKANKKQTALRIEDFVSKTKPKDQVTQLLEGIRIKRALDNQYKKLADKASEKLKQDINDITSKSKDREISDRIKAEELKVITDKQDAEVLNRQRLLDAQRERRQLQLDSQKERRQLLLTDQRQQDIERRQNLLEDARDMRRDNVQNLRQQDIEDREEAKYQRRQALKITRPRGRPPGAVGLLGAIETDDGDYDGTYSSVSRDALVGEARALGISTAGTKEAIAKRIINRKPELEEAAELFTGLEAMANIPHRPKLELTADILKGAKSKLTTSDEEALLPIGKVESIPSKAKPMSFLTDLTAGLGKKLKKSETSGLLDTQAAQDAAEATLRRDKERALEEVANRPKPSRANKSYKLETVEGMIAELKHRGIPLPQRSKLAYVKGNQVQQDIPLSDFKQLLFAEMKK